jgi:diacylglycerol O-acyltransferase
MDKLTALDANFLYAESAQVINHVASVQEFSLPNGSTSTEFVAGLKTFLMDRIHTVPYLSRKIIEVPGGVDHPSWVRDTAFHIDNHVYEVVLDFPGSHAQLEAKVAELHSELMDRSKPLWKLIVISGLADGTVAYYNQVHHACIDGMAGQAATMILMDNTLDHPVHNVPEDFFDAEDTSMRRLFGQAFENLVAYQLGTIKRTIGVIDSTVSMTQRAIDPSKSFGALAELAPRTPFSNGISSSRSFSCGKLSLTNAKAMGKSLDAKVNDVFMTACSGGLRTYLERKGQLPTTTIIAGCPVSLRAPGAQDMGNAVTLMQVALATDIRDPRIRLLKIKSSANIAKEVTADLAAGYEPNVSLPGLPNVLSNLAKLTTSTNDFIPMPFNVVISNVPGPREVLYSNGAKMLSHYPVSIPTHGLGLNITVQSYCDSLYFSITACETAVPNAEELKQDILDAFIELKALLLPENVTAIRKENVATHHAIHHAVVVKQPQVTKLGLSEELSHKVA